MPSAANEIVIARPPEDVFQFLANPENSFMTGQTVDPNGGSVMP